MLFRWLQLFILFLSTSCLAFSEVEISPSRSPWLEVKWEAEKQKNASPPLSPTLNNPSLRAWLAKVRANPDIVEFTDLDLLRQDWSAGVDIPAFRRILKKAYIAAPKLRGSFAAKRLEAFLFLQAGDVKSARASLTEISAWCEKPNSGGDGFNRYGDCSPMLLSWTANGKFTLDSDTSPERIELLEQTFDCANTGDDHDVPDLLEFDLAGDAHSADAVAQLAMRYLWDALLQGCSLKYSGTALRVLVPHVVALRAASDQALQGLDQGKATGDFEFLQDHLPWPKNECDFARAPDCALHRKFSAQQKRYVLRRISALAAQLSLTDEQSELRQQRAELLHTAAQTRLHKHEIDDARSSFAEALSIHWTAETDFSARLIDALLLGAAPPPTVNPKPTKSGWIYGFEWFDERAFKSDKLIYKTLLLPEEFLKLQRRQAWERVLAQASYVVTQKSSVDPGPALMRLQGTWHGDHLQIEDLKLPWPAQFEWAVASSTEVLPEQERLALFARMKVIVAE